MNSYMRYRPSHFALMIIIYGEIIYVSDEICAKMTQEPNYKSKKIQILGENGINSKLKHRKTHNLILSVRFGDQYRRPGDWCRIQEGRVGVYAYSIMF